MNKTNHFKQRCQERGINSDMLEYILEYGIYDRDKVTITKKIALDLLKNPEYKHNKELTKIVDKGGITIILVDNALLTTYKCNKKKKYNWYKK
jgi:hypothetical protein